MLLQIIKGCISLARPIEQGMKHCCVQVSGVTGIFQMLLLNWVSEPKINDFYLPVLAQQLKLIVCFFSITVLRFIYYMRTWKNRDPKNTIQPKPPSGMLGPSSGWVATTLSNELLSLILFSCNTMSCLCGHQ